MVKDQFDEWDRFSKTNELSKSAEIAMTRYKRWRALREQRKLQRYIMKMRKETRLGGRGSSRASASCETATSSDSAAMKSS